MNEAFSTIRRGVDRYYTAKFEQYGATAKGVDWNSEESQHLRFDVLATVVDPTAPYVVLDYGCGYGALYDHLAARGDSFSYVGFDVSTAMVDATGSRLAPHTGATVTADPQMLAPADYTLASGIFNVKQDVSGDDWTEYVFATLDHVASLSRRGFSFNMLTAYSDADRMRPDLYYGSPTLFFDHCKRRYSRHVALLHDYGLYEFTVRVRLEDM